MAKPSVPLYRLGVTESGEEEVEVKSVFLFTERGVYKPGDIVHLKGFARSLDERSIEPSGGKDAQGHGDGCEGPGILQQSSNALRFRFVRGGDHAPGGNARKISHRRDRRRRAIG